MRRSIIVGYLTLLLLPALCGAVAPDASAPRSERPAATLHAPLADRDGDGIADSLQARLAQAHPEDRFDVVVTFQQPGHAAAARQALGNFVPHREFKIIPGFAGSLSAAQIRALSHAPGLVRIEEDVKVHTQLDAARADFGVDTARGLPGNVSGSGVGICTVDTGVDPNHEQLAGKVAGFVDYVGGKSTPYDDHGHGTHVASIAAGGGMGSPAADTYRGVAPGASIYAAKALDAQGGGSLSNVVAGIDWCAGQAGVHVISMSLAATPPADGTDAMSQAVNAAVTPTTPGQVPKVVVVAAGNDGDEPGTVGSPGAAAGAITVGACAEWSVVPAVPPGTPINPNDPPLQHSDGVYLTAFSSRGPITDSHNTVLRIKPDICAPGHTITAAKAGTVNGYATYSGTSMATPFVAGSVALALQANSALKGNPAQVRSLLEGTAQDRGAAGKDNEWGAGLLDVYAFVARAQDASSTRATVFPGHTRVVKSVGDNVIESYSFDVSDLDKPIGAIVTITSGGPVCIWQLFNLCFAYAWLPDLDAWLYAPDGTVLSESLCMGGASSNYGMSDECASPNSPLVALGRQETLHAMPTKTGTYRIDVRGAQDSTNNGKGGNFALDLSFGSPAAVVVTPDFTLFTSPGSQSVVSGASTSYTTTVTPSGGFNSGVDLSVSNLPAGANGSFSPNQVSGGSGPSSLTVSTSSSTPAGSYPLTISGTSGILTRTSSVTLVVTGFDLSANPGYQEVLRNSVATYTETVTPYGSFDGEVALSISKPPSGVSASFTPVKVTKAGGYSSTLKLSVGSRAKRGTYILTITGTSGGQSRTNTVGLAIK